MNSPAFSGVLLRVRAWHPAPFNGGMADTVSKTESPLSFGQQCVTVPQHRLQRHRLVPRKRFVPSPKPHPRRARSGGGPRQQRSKTTWTSGPPRVAFPSDRGNSRPPCISNDAIARAAIPPLELGRETPKDSANTPRAFGPSESQSDAKPGVACRASGMLAAQEATTLAVRLMSSRPALRLSMPE